MERCENSVGQRPEGDVPTAAALRSPQSPLTNGDGIARNLQRGSRGPRLYVDVRFDLPTCYVVAVFIGVVEEPVGPIAADERIDVTVVEHGGTGIEL